MRRPSKGEVRRCRCKRWSNIFVLAAALGAVLICAATKRQNDDTAVTCGSTRRGSAVIGAVSAATFVSSSWSASATGRSRRMQRDDAGSMMSATGADDDDDDNDVEGRGLTTVAVIGGGIAGLSCAEHLAAGGTCIPTVFDTGRLRPGGRCSSRQPCDPAKGDRGHSRATILGSHVIDHAAQILTVSEPNGPFARQVELWEEEGVLRKFPRGSVCEILPDEKRPFRVCELNGEVGSDRCDTDEEVDMYYGVNGMGNIPAVIALEGHFEVKQDVWVSPSNGVKYVGTGWPRAADDDVDGDAVEPHRPRWRVKAKGQILGEFDRLVIAHNGKCADRLMSKTPARALHSLLRVNFNPTVPASGGKRMTLNSIYSLAFAIGTDEAAAGAEGGPAPSVISGALPGGMISAFVKNEPTLRFLSCNTRKHEGDSPGGGGGIEVWTLLSSAKFAKKYKAPQENLPPETVEDVTGLMLSALERSLGLGDGAVSGAVLDSRLQLWGAALPLNTWAGSSSPGGFAYDAEFGVGACGDWLLRPSIEGAWESGRRLADWINGEVVDADPGGSRGRKKPISSFSVGLPPHGGKFQVSSSALENGIGSFKSDTTPVSVASA